MKPLHAKFKVYPKGSWYFFHVFIWKRLGDMRRALKASGASYQNAEAICCCNRLITCKHGNMRMTGLLGQIHFYTESFSMGVITHESGHAAFGWAYEKGVDPTRRIDGSGNVTGHEEQFCWVLGNIARQIVLKANQQWKFPSSAERKVKSYT